MSALYRSPNGNEDYYINSFDDYFNENINNSNNNTFRFIGDINTNIMSDNEVSNNYINLMTQEKTVDLIYTYLVMSTKLPNY